MTEKPRGGTHAHGIQVEVDRDLCIGFRNCVKFAPGAFRMDAEEIAVVVDPTAATSEELDKARRLCPAAAIRLQKSR